MARVAVSFGWQSMDGQRKEGIWVIDQAEIMKPGKMEWANGSERFRRYDTASTSGDRHKSCQKFKFSLTEYWIPFEDCFSHKLSSWHFLG